MIGQKNDVAQAKMAIVREAAKSSEQEVFGRDLLRAAGNKDLTIDEVLDALIAAGMTLVVAPIGARQTAR